MGNITTDDLYGTKEIHKYLLNEMKDLDLFCRENRIVYSIVFGTMLGAIRHGGFIPWDDDVDILMDRKNYTKFIKKIDAGYNSKYQIVDKLWIKRITRKDNSRAKEDIGCIDIFVLDNVPQNKIARVIKLYLILFLQGTFKKDIDYTTVDKKYVLPLFVTSLIGRFVSHKHKLAMYEFVSKWGNNSETEYMKIYNNSFVGVKRLTWESKRMKRYTNIAFENIRVMMLKEYDYHLSETYGDYMKMPDVSQRIPEHIK